MKNTILISLMTFLPILGHCQAQMNSKIQMTTEFGSTNPEVQDMMSFEEIEYYKVKFVGPEIKGKNFYILAKEMRNGKLSKVDTVINTLANERIEPISTDTLSFRVTAKKTQKNELRLHFAFPKFRTEKVYSATDSNDYSLRDVGTGVKIEPGKEFAAFAYILPFEKNGWKMYCEVENSGKDIENWGKEFGIEHYLIFEMKFE